MPQDYNFLSPGGEAVDALTMFLAKQEQAKRQKMLDEITAKREDRMVKTQEDQQQLQRDQFDYGRADKLATMAGAHERVSPDVENLLTKAGLGGRIEEQISQQATPGFGVLAEADPGAHGVQTDKFLKPGAHFEEARVAAEEKSAQAQLIAQQHAEQAAQHDEELKARADADRASREAIAQAGRENSAAIAAGAQGIRTDAAAEKKAGAEKDALNKRNTARSMANSVLSTLDQIAPQGALTPGMKSLVGGDPLTVGGVAIPGTDTIGGAISHLKKYAPGTQEADADSLLKQLQSQLVVELIGEMKSQSRTGATGFGALSEKEGEILRNAAGRLGTKQSEAQFQGALNEIRKTLMKVFDEPSAGPVAPVTTGSVKPAAGVPSPGSPGVVIGGQMTPASLRQKYGRPR